MIVQRKKVTRKTIVLGHLPRKPVPTVLGTMLGESAGPAPKVDDAHFAALGRWLTKCSRARNYSNLREGNARERSVACLAARVIPEGVEPPSPLCKRGVVAVGPRDVFIALLSSSTGGSRTHRHQSLELIAMPIRVPCLDRIAHSSISGPGSRTAASEHMKLGRAPAHPHVPGPGIEPGEPAL